MISLSRLWSWLTVNSRDEQSADSDKAHRDDNPDNFELNITVEKLTIKGNDTEKPDD